MLLYCAVLSEVVQVGLTDGLLSMLVVAVRKHCRKASNVHNRLWCVL
jgi:hypothetical protein